MSTDKYEAHDSRRGIIRSTGIISLGTLSSRILGFIRDILIARLLGTESHADAFFVAFRIPNLFRDLAGEGATNSALVPVFSEYEAKKDRAELWRFVSSFLILSLLVLGTIVIIGVLCAPLIVRMMAPGFVFEEAKLKTTIDLTRLMFPYLILIALTAYGMGMLYTFRSFVVPAFSPCLLNVSMILMAFLAAQTGQDPVLFLAIGVLIGGVAQLSVHVRPLLKEGMRLSTPKNLFHPGAVKVGKLLFPRLFGAAVYQINIIIDTFCASLSSIVGVGGISAIYYANRIIQFPMGLIGVSLASAILPSLSGFAARENMDDLKKTIIFSLENIFLIMLPISIFLLLLSVPITRILFERGEFNVYSTQITSWALFFSAFGLVGFGGAKIMVTVFHSLQDTATPVRVGFLCLVTNAVLNFILMRPLHVGGIALASSIASTVNFLLLFYILEKRLKLRMAPAMLKSFLKSLGASAFMGLGVYTIWHGFEGMDEIARFVVTGIFGLFFFVTACYIFRVKQVQEILRWISKKK